MNPGRRLVASRSGEAHLSLKEMMDGLPSSKSLHFISGGWHSGKNMHIHTCMHTHIHTLTQFRLVHICPALKSTTRAWTGTAATVTRVKAKLYSWHHCVLSFIVRDVFVPELFLFCFLNVQLIIFPLSIIVLKSNLWGITVSILFLFVIYCTHFCPSRENLVDTPMSTLWCMQPIEPDNTYAGTRWEWKRHAKSARQLGLRWWGLASF